MNGDQCESGFYIEPLSTGILVNKMWATSAFFLYYVIPTSLMLYLYGRVVYTMRTSNAATSTVADKVINMELCIHRF